MGLGWCLAGVVAAITIAAIPFRIQHIKLDLISLAPIGMQVVPGRRCVRAARPRRRKT